MKMRFLFSIRGRAIGIMFLAAVPVSRSNGAATTLPTTAPATAATLLNGVADHSLAATDYITMGLASYDRAWGGREMVLAAQTLQKLYATSSDQLPRFGSERSGKMFDRILSSDNFDFYQSRTLPLSTRFPDALQYVVALNTIYKLYATAQDAGKVSGRDSIEILGAQLRLVRVELSLADELIPTLNKEDPHYSYRLAGITKMQAGLAEMLSGVLTTLAESTTYDLPMRLTLLRYCRETFPDIIPKLTSPSQSELLVRLNSMADDRTQHDLRMGLLTLLDDVRLAQKRVH